MIESNLKPYPNYKPSGVEWLGDVPTHWEVRRLKDWVGINEAVLSETTDPSFELDDLDPAAVDVLRRLWQHKAPDQDISTRPVEQLLTDAELLVDGEVTYAALILLGTRKALGKYLAQAELIFEYRSNEVPGPAGERREFRQGFLPVLDEIWRLVNQRNNLQHFQQGFFIWDVPTFNERVVREAVLNAVSHRDIECVGRGRGGRLLSRQFYRHIGQAGVYTRKRGLDRETNKELLLKHIRDNRKEGSQLRELRQVLPALSYAQVQKLLQELRIKGQIHKVGNTSATRWYPGGPPSELMPKQ